MACHGNAEGVNKAVCFVNSSLPPDSQEYSSVVDTCAKDDKGQLYVASSSGDSCGKNGCDDATGLCKKAKASCDLDCRVMDKREEACFVINGTPTCKETCLADKEGKNDPVCYMEGGFMPSYEPDSAVDECKKDDNGDLYSIGTEIVDECNYGCDEATGLCKEQDAECAELKCEQTVGDGKAHICVKIDGKAECRTNCLGTYEGENKAVCFENTSLAPENRTQYSVVDTCARDDDGKLYSKSANESMCRSGCDESTGLCSNDDHGGV